MSTVLLNNVVREPQTEFGFYTWPSGCSAASRLHGKHLQRALTSEATLHPSQRSSRSTHGNFNRRLLCGGAWDDRDLAHLLPLRAGLHLLRGLRPVTTTIPEDACGFAHLGIGVLMTILQLPARCCFPMTLRLQ
eukprot:6489454-Amphidinium_carterae.1